MKGRILGLLMAVLLLTACTGEAAPENAASETSRPSAEESVSAQSSAPVEEKPDLTEGAVWINEEKTAYDITACVPEGDSCSDLLVLEDQLILLWTKYGSDGSTELSARSIHQQTGEETGSLQQTGGSFCSFAKANHKFFYIYDSWEGWLKIYNSQLTLEKEHRLSPDRGEWYLSEDLAQLYCISWDEGVRRIDLETLTEYDLLPEAAEVFAREMGDGWLCIEYWDTQQQRDTERMLNMQTGEFSESDLVGNYGQIRRRGDTWCMNRPYNWNEYVVAQGDQMNSVTLEEGSLQLSEGGHLLRREYYVPHLTLYDIEGKYLAGCTISDESLYVSDRMEWSEARSGYFFLLYSYEGKQAVIFWDTSAQQEGQALPLQPYEPPIAHEGALVSAELYEWAGRLSEQYDLDIRIAEQCAQEYPDFEGEILTDEAAIQQTLELLERTLAAYPEGFFTQLKCGELTGIRIEIVRGLVRTASEEGDDYNDFAAFVTAMEDYRLMVLDANQIAESSIYHEFSHMIDARLDYDFWMTDDSIYSESAWLELQPEGYEFPHDFSDVPDYVMDAVNNGYFINEYGGTFPTEDRATIMEQAMAGNHAVFTENLPLMAKLVYYSECIRDCFDTTGWPEVTRWEEPLRR